MTWQAQKHVPKQANPSNLSEKAHLLAVADSLLRFIENAAVGFQIL
jgi:hypothetical protein